MDHKENKQTKNYFEQLLALLSTTRNAVLLMLAFFAMTNAINNFTLLPDWHGYGLPPFIVQQRDIEVQLLKTSAYSIAEVKKDYNYLDHPFKHVHKWNWFREPGYTKGVEPLKVPRKTFFRWKSWENHRSRMTFILGY